MAEKITPPVALGWQAQSFTLNGTDESVYTLESIRGKNGTVVMFLCNHCPYVRSAIGRIVRDMTQLLEHGVGSIAIMPNDTVTYPEDRFDKMKEFAEQHAFSFPYVIDETQEVAHMYDAVCTPDFFGLDRHLTLQYRGRLDASRLEPLPNARRDLFEAMKEIAQQGTVSGPQFPSIGCSIKWKN